MNDLVSRIKDQIKSDGRFYNFNPKLKVVNKSILIDGIVRSFYEKQMVLNNIQKAMNPEELQNFMIDLRLVVKS